MARDLTSPRTLWAVSDLHVRAPGNREMVEAHLRPQNPGDWLIVAGDVAEDVETVIDILAMLQQRYAHVIYTPGNHELYARTGDHLVGRSKYDALIEQVSRLGVSTPESPFPRFAGHTIVPMFTLYDHSWRAEGLTRDQALAAANNEGVVLTDAYTVEPYVDVELWCRDRLTSTVRRLAGVETPTILINHWPLARQCMDRVRYPQIGLWSGTRHTQSWPARYKASAVIHGHLHIPVETVVDGVTHAEVSLGYPRERERSLPPRLVRGLWPYPVLRETNDPDEVIGATRATNDPDSEEVTP